MAVRAQAVVQVGDVDAQVKGRRQAGQDVEQRDGVGPAGHADDDPGAPLHQVMLDEGQACLFKQVAHHASRHIIHDIHASVVGRDHLGTNASPPAFGLKTGEAVEPQVG